MIIDQQYFQNGKWTRGSHSSSEDNTYQLVLGFGSFDVVSRESIFSDITARYPGANIVLCSTAGEVIDQDVLDDSIVVTAIAFEKTRVQCCVRNLADTRSSFETGRSLMNALNADDLAGIFVVSDGSVINGSELVSGFNDSNSRRIPIIGGLAGDGARFLKTLTGLNQLPTEGNVIAIGFYGKDLVIGHGSFGGWDEFGRERTITKSEKNVLYEIDGESALKLYKEYLGDYAGELPGSALLFPLSLKMEDTEGVLVRTILGIDEEKDSMTFAGNMPEGSKVRLMKANFDQLIDSAAHAAEKSCELFKEHRPELAIIVSCVGRKLVLQHRITEEVELAREILGEKVAITGFYSYGEISPFNNATDCQLHNQTFTITSFSEQ